MTIHLDSRGQQLIERLLRSGLYRSAADVVVSALEALNERDQAHMPDDERRLAVQEMLEFAGKHGFTLGAELSLKDLIHEGHKY